MTKTARTTNDGVKIWIAPKIHGIGEGIQDGQIAVVRREDHDAKVASLQEQSDNRHERALSYARECDELKAKVEALEQENAILKANYQTLLDDAVEMRQKLARYERAVTDEEWSKVSGYEANDVSYASRESVDALVSRRTAGPDGEATSEQSGSRSDDPS